MTIENLKGAQACPRRGYELVKVTKSSASDQSHFSPGFEYVPWTPSHRNYSMTRAASAVFNGQAIGGVSLLNQEGSYQSPWHRTLECHDPYCTHS